MRRRRNEHTPVCIPGSYTEHSEALKSILFKNFNERKNENEKRSEASKRIEETKVGFLVSVLLNVMENSVFTFVSMCCFWKYVLYIYFNFSALHIYLMRSQCLCDAIFWIQLFLFFRWVFNWPIKLIFGIYSANNGKNEDEAVPILEWEGKKTENKLLVKKEDIWAEFYN